VLLNDAKDITAKHIHHSVEIKNKVVLADPFEKNIRKTLNYGHTIGHAIESWSLINDKNSLLHGEAIAIGMICEAYLAKETNGLSEEDLDKITNTFIKFFGRYKIREGINNALLDIMKQDKKNSDGKISFSLPNKIGSCSFDTFIEERLILESLKYYQSV
ncbi:MAG: 3-dehydroquinate synthase, partial [Oligoflexus sp.]|nr:3-dehydroquinate synthase [Pseudopedobacter sp.]